MVISATTTVCFTNSTPEILAHFDELTGPRLDRTKLHAIIDLVAIAPICGAAGWADVERFGRMKWDWFAKFLELPHGIPSHDNFDRVFGNPGGSQALGTDGGRESRPPSASVTSTDASR